MSGFSRCCCLFLLVKILTGRGITSKFVCPGDSVQLFKLSNFDGCNAVVYLYVHGNRFTQIAKWTLRNCTLNSSLLPEYENKVYFNTNGTILIHDVQTWDDGRYMMRKEDTLPMTYEEQLYVMELPKKECKPKISQLGNSLHVSLNYDVCGKPPATPYWRACCGVSYSNESVITFSPGKEACTCYACIVSPALKCARNSTSLDYCSFFNKGGTKTTPVSLETMDFKMVVFLTVVITLVISVLLVIIIRVILRRRKRGIARRKLNTSGPEFDSDDDDPTEWQRNKALKQSDAKVRQRYKESKQSAEMQDVLPIPNTQPSTVIESDDPKKRKKYKMSKQSDAKVRQTYKESTQSAEMQDQLPIPHTQPSIVIESDDAKVRQTYKESTQSAEMQDLLPIPNTQPSTVIESDAKMQDLLPIQKTQPSPVIESDDPKPMTEQASIMHPLIHNSNLIREKGPDPSHCAFCGQENSAMFVLPCEHLGCWYMPACIKCGISRGPCEQCMASKRKSMEFATWTVLTDSARN